MNKNLYQILFPKGKEKAFTLSYDDGVTQDIELIKLLNKYNLKATFNLNSGCFGKNGEVTIYENYTTHNKMRAEEIKDIYKGHEVAIHTLTHQHLEYMCKDEIIYEVLKDKENLERIVGYPVRGMAYPYGTYNQLVLDTIKDLGVEYARTVKSTKNFSIPQNFLEWNPTAKYDEENIFELIEMFLNSEEYSCDKTMAKIFYVWGHSYELPAKDMWEHMEKLCKLISRKANVWYATNIQIVDYINAVRNLKFSVDGNIVYNPNSMNVWIKRDEQVILIEAGRTKNI